MRQRIRRDDKPDERALGRSTNRGSPRGQIILSNDGGDHTIGQCWELLFIMNAQAPAPYKFTDDELTERMHELFPRRIGVRITEQPFVWRRYYNLGMLHPQKWRNGGEPLRPEKDFFSWRYVRVRVEQTLITPETASWPYEVYACTARGTKRYRAYPPEPEVKLKQLQHLFTIPRYDWSEFPYPQQAKNLWRDIRRERMEAERQAFAAYCSEWLAKQKAERPQDFDPLLWKDPKW
jgi:hypothetical protein